MTNDEFEATYKFSTAMHFTLLFGLLIFFICSFFLCFLFFENITLVVMCVVLILINVLLIFYCIKGIFLWFGKDNIIKISNGKFYYYRGFFTRNRCVSDIALVSQATVGTWRGEVKVLEMRIDKKRYMMSDNLLKEQDFSRLCNVFVKISRRCKACQSDMVEWKGAEGHCHRCETITPLLADDFDWKSAYQA